MRLCFVTGQRLHAEAAEVKALHKRCSSVTEKLHFQVKGNPFSSAHLKIYNARKRTTVFRLLLKPSFAQRIQIDFRHRM